MINKARALRDILHFVGQYAIQAIFLEAEELQAKIRAQFSIALFDAGYEYVA